MPSPVTNDARSLLSQTTASATSSGSHNRPPGCTLVTRSMIPGSTSSQRVIKGVRTAPGHTALTRMLSRRCSVAAVRVSPMTACFDAAYAGLPGVPMIDAADAVFTTEPKPCASIWRSSARMQSQTPLTLTSMTRS